jgi:uncharacterized metal-binding protein
MAEKNFTELYNDQDLKVLKVAEDSLNPRVDRVHEIIAYAHEAKINKIGIANCISFNKEAIQLEDIFRNAGFEVEKVHCKYGKVPFDDLLPGYRGTSCNPAGQAEYLEEKDTQLNVMMGLCLGHDIIFNSKSKATETPLIVKDRKTKHKTIQVFEQDAKGI